MKRGQNTMLIPRTPFRMSFFFGGTDMENYFKENGGAVFSTTFGYIRSGHGGKSIRLVSNRLTGSGGGKSAPIADLTVAVGERETYKVQELHLPIYHCICMMLEERFLGRG